MRRAADPVTVVEAAYRPSSDDDWLGGLAESMRPHLDEGLGTLALFVDSTRSMPGSPAILAGRALGLSPASMQLSSSLSDFGSRQRELFRTARPVVRLARLLGAPWREHVDAAGAPPDAVYLQAGEFDRRLCVFVAPRAKLAALPVHRRHRLERLCAHVASACRLRETSSTGDPEAIVDPRTERVVHATGAASTSDALTTLRAAALAIDRARGPLRRTDADAALEIWRALVDGRWSILDRFESDGRRYLVARRNEPESIGAAVLTERESQVAALVARGHPNKLIAYELGIAVETVATHVARIKAKLGVATRADLVGRLLLGADASPPSSAPITDRSAGPRRGTS